MERLVRPVSRKGGDNMCLVCHRECGGLRVADPQHPALGLKHLAVPSVPQCTLGGWICNARTALCRQDVRDRLRTGRDRRGRILDEVVTSVIGYGLLVVAG